MEEWLAYQEAHSTIGMCEDTPFSFDVSFNLIEGSMAFFSLGVGSIRSENEE
ncbi:MAG: hypothetical protein Q4G58_10255 [bacterium]|nr:hypothetical protein [bacterium]